MFYELNSENNIKTGLLLPNLSKK